MEREFEVKKARFRDVCASDHEAIRLLLCEAHLPTEDLQDDRFAHFVVCEIDKTIAGVIGLEPYGSQALVRSLVVARQHRSHGMAAQLLIEIEKRAIRIGAVTLFALTTTAQQWLERQGFAVLNRNQVPAAIQASSQFRELCPDSAIVLWKSIACGRQLRSEE